VGGEEAASKKQAGSRQASRQTQRGQGICRHRDGCV
jgi:hypothetical protein